MDHKKIMGLVVLFFSLSSAALCPMKGWIDAETIAVLRAAVNVQADGDDADGAGEEAGTIRLFQQTGDGDNGLWCDANGIQYVTKRTIFEAWLRRHRAAQRFCWDFFLVLTAAQDYYLEQGGDGIFSPTLPRRGGQCLTVLFDQRDGSALKKLELLASDGLLSREDVNRFNRDLSNFVNDVVTHRTAALLLGQDIETYGLEKIIQSSLYSTLFARRDKGRSDCCCGGCVVGATCAAACVYWAPGCLKCLLAAMFL